MSLVSDYKGKSGSLLEIRYTDVFAKWFARLRDRMASIRITAYFEKAQAIGDLHGDFKAIGDHVIKVRFDVGPGYRVYATRKGDRLVLLLAGGDKSTQNKDIKKAKELAREWRLEDEDL